MGFLYIIRCSDDTLYTGSTKQLHVRISQHKNGTGAQYTKVRRPLELIFVQNFTSVSEAFYMEKQIQNWSKRKKLALVDSDFNQLKIYAKKIF